MKYKFFFGAAISTLFFGVAVAGLSHVPSESKAEPAPVETKRSVSRAAEGEYDETSFADSIALTRDDLRVDVSSYTSTPSGRTISVTFNSSRLVGWPTTEKNAFVIIDDEHYSGSPSNPSLDPEHFDPLTTPFDGYTVEMEYLPTLTLNYGTGESEVYRKEIVIPEIIEYTGKFRINNKAIYENAFIFTKDEAHTKPSKDRVEWIIIPDGIEVIQSKAFQNVPDFIRFKCEAASKPEGWASDWCDVSDPATQIEWGYTLVDQSISGKAYGNETDYLLNATGSGERYYGDLTYAAVNDSESMYFVIDDPDWSGDYANPSKSGSSSHTFDGYVFTVKDSASNPDIIFPEKVVYNGVTIVNKKIPTDIIDFLFDTVNSYTTDKYPKDAGFEITLDSAKFEEAYYNAPKTTSFRYVVNATDPSKSGWTLSGKLVDLEEYGITVTGSPVNNNYLYIFKETGESYFGHVNSITIPMGIEVVESGAFSKLPDTTKVYCEYQPSVGEAKKQPYWSDSWIAEKYIDKVVWGHEVAASDKILNATHAPKLVRLGNDGTTYILGYKYTQHDKYYCEEEKAYYEVDEIVDGKTPFGHDATLIKDETPEYNLPIVVSYEVKNKDSGDSHVIYQELPLLSEEATSKSTSYYDSVKTSSFSRNFDVLLEDDEELQLDKIKIYNIYQATTVKKVVTTVENEKVVTKVQTFTIPNTKVSFHIQTPKETDIQKVDVSEVINYRFKELSSFSGYFTIAMEIDRYIDENGETYWSRGIEPSVYEEYKSYITSGKYRVRFTLNGIHSSFYRITYFSPTSGQYERAVMRVQTPNGVVPLEKDYGNKVSFCLEEKSIYYTNDAGKKVYDFKLENLRHFELLSVSINMHLWNVANSSIVGRTDCSIRFSGIDVMPLRSDAPKIYSIPLFIVLFTVIYTVVFAAGAAGLFFYLKNKYKNDEFRRMKPKQYIKTSILGYVGSLIISLTIVFIAFRAGRFSNSVASHNPLDIYIVIPGVVSIVVIGYFIKFVVVKLKANKQRKVIRKLKLNDDVKDDGTN